jgi:coenzyme F420 hydrogenase subunit beta
MSGVERLEQIVKVRQCMGCGFCTLIQPSSPGERVPTVTMEFDDLQDLFVPQVLGWESGDPVGEFCCPGTEMDMVGLASARYGRQPADPILGEAIGIRACYSTDVEERQRSASGGVVPAILDHLFKTDAIDAAYCLRSEAPPRESRGEVVKAATQLAAIHGSVYHPARLGTRLSDLAKGTERFAFVGLPCEIAGLEMLKKINPSLRERHVLSIGLFCGGINTFRGIDYYLKRFGVQLQDVEEIDYRYGSWPGRIRAVLKDGSVREIARIAGNSRWNILHYAIAFQGYWMLPRCRICPDQISDFADIAVGDPHLPRFRAQHGVGFSAAISRTEAGEKVLREAIDSGRIAAEPLSREEVITSQGYTLDNRRHAQVYAKVGRWFGFKPPTMTTYDALAGSVATRHYRYAVVDMFKLRVPTNAFTQLLFMPWQIFEYLFITFTPSLVGKRLAKLVRNEGG